MTRRLANDVHMQTVVFVGDHQAAHALADAIPYTLVQSHCRRDDDGFDAALAPAAAFDGVQLRPGRAGQMRTFAAAVAPAEDLQPALAPDRQQALGVGEEKLHLALTAAIMDAPLQD